MQDFIKLSDLSKGKTSFLVENIDGPVWKMWDAGSKKMVISKVPMTGMRKTYTLTTDKGKFDLGEQNLGTLFCLSMVNGQADIIGKQFQVSDNGKSGLDIRYYFNHIKETSSDEMNVDEMPTW